ncbi:MAG TPA: glycosyltransferase [Humisphaera sp.]
MPLGAVVRDAGQVVSRDELGRWGVTAASDLFSYRVLSRFGGWYSDLDAVLMKPIDLPGSFVSARQPGGTVGVGLLYQDGPGGVAEVVLDRAERVGPGKGYCAIGPPLMTRTLGELGVIPFPSYTFYPWAYTSWRTALCPNGRLPAGAYSVHLYTQMFRLDRVDQDGPFPGTSIVEQLCRLYGD